MNEHEKKTIDAFIIKERRERYKLFLDNQKKRSKELDRLNGSRDLDPRYRQWLTSKVGVDEILRKKGCPKQVYLISADIELDGKTLPLDEALDAVFMHGWGTIISCIPGKLAYFYGELGSRTALLERE